MAATGYLRELTANGGARITPFNAPQPVLVEVFTNATRPDAANYPKSAAIWNDDDHAYNYADGLSPAHWRDAVGTIT